MFEIKDALKKETLEAVAAMAPSPESNEQSARNRTNGFSRLKVEEWLRDRGVGFHIKDGDLAGRTIYVLDACPFNADHKNDAHISQDISGKLGASCFHNGCTGNGWKEFKHAIGHPEAKHYDPPLHQRTNTQKSEQRKNRTFFEGLNVVCMSQVKTQQIQWLWPGRIALGKTHIFVGRPGIGKSFFTTEITAVVTNGENFPDESECICPGEVLYLCGEDGLGDTLRPRLDLAGADVAKVHVIISRRMIPEEGADPIEEHIRLDRDIAEISKLLESRPDIRLLWIDPLSEYLGRTDSHKNAEVRGLLAPLSRMAEERNIAVCYVEHFNKGSFGPAIYRAMGSLAFTAHARIGWAFVPDREDEERILFLPLKNNVGKRVPGMAYRITDHGIVWEDTEVTISVDEAMSESKGPKPDKLKEASDWLQQFLTKHGCTESDRLRDEAESAGVSFSTLKRARKKLDCISSKNNASGKWFVSLPVESDAAF